MKIYTKRGNKNYKEKRMLKDLEPLLERKISENPNFEQEFLPASNFSELQKLHEKYVVEDVEIEEENSEKKEIISNRMAKKELDIEDVEFEEQVKAKAPASKTQGNVFIDPFNREEPIVRDYVMDGGFKEEKTAPEQPTKTFFEEPTSFEEAFEIPENVEEAESPKQESTVKKDRPIKEALNPDFDEMSTGKKKRSTKKFAKYIVEAVATLSQKGFVWYANQDINEAKLAEYEMSGEMDLSLLVSLEDGQEVTVKKFFQVQCEQAEMLSHWTDEQKEDMSIALAEVLMEKGIAPTPTQELLLITLTIIGGQAMTLLTLKSQTNSLLNQLRSMNDGSQPIEQTYTEPPTPTPAQTPQATSTNEQAEYSDREDYVDVEPQMNDDYEMLSELASMTEEDVLISDDNIETKE